MGTYPFEKVAFIVELLDHSYKVGRNKPIFDLASELAYASHVTWFGTDRSVSRPCSRPTFCTSCHTF